MKNSLRLGKPTLADLLAPGSITSAFYDFDESATYRLACFSVTDVRRVAPELARRCDAILAFSDDPESLNFLNEVVLEPRVQRKSKLVGTAARRGSLRDVAPDGNDLLNLEAPVTFDSLKQARREAAKTHHPDVGGGTRTMQTINDAFDRLWQALTSGYVDRAQLLTLADGDGETAIDVLQHACALRLGIAMDDGDVEGVLQNLRSCSNHGRHGPREIADGSIQRFLHLSSLVRGSEEAAKIMRACLVAGDPPQSGKRLSIVHLRQAENACRYGALTAKSLEQWRVRFAILENERLARHNLIERYAREEGFAHLLEDPDGANAGAEDRLTARSEAGYIVLLVSLSTEQRAAYARIFGPRPSLHNYEDFLGTRIAHVFRAVFNPLESVTFETLHAESKVLAAATKSGINLKVDADKLVEILDWLGELPKAERDERIASVGRLASWNPSDDLAHDRKETCSGIIWDNSLGKTVGYGRSLRLNTGKWTLWLRLPLDQLRQLEARSS